MRSPEPSSAVVRERSRDLLGLLRDIIVTSGARVYSTLVSLVALMLTARWLGPDGRGVVVVVTTWVTLFSSIGYLSLGQVCVHRAANEPDQQWIGPALGALATVAVTATLFGWVAISVLYALARHKLFAGIPLGALTLGFAALPLAIWEQYGSALLSVIGKLGIYNINQVVGRTLSLAILLITILGLGLGIYGFLIAYVAGQLAVSSAGAAVLVRHARGRLKGGLKAVGWLVRDGLKIHLNAIGVLLFSGADIIMLQYFRGPPEAGIFQLPMQLFLALLLVPQSAQLALQSRVSGRSRGEFWREHRAIMVAVIGGMAGIAVILWLLAPWLILLVGSRRFEGSAAVFRILLLGVPGACFNTMMQIQWVIRGRFLLISGITLTTGVLNCLLNLILIPAYGSHGAAIATVAGLYLIPVSSSAVLVWHVSRESAHETGRG